MENNQVWVVHQKGYDGDHIVAICKSEDTAVKVCGNVNNVYEPAYVTVYELQ